MDTAERKRRYAQEKQVLFELRFSPEKDADILARLDLVDSKNGYLRMLLKNDLIRKGILPGPIESYSMTIHKGRDRTTTYNCRTNIKLIAGGPDQPIIDYLQHCRSKIDYIRSLIRQDIDSGGDIAERVTTPKSYLDVCTVRASAERTSKLLQDLSTQDKTQAEQAKPVIKALDTWIDTHK